MRILSISDLISLPLYGECGVSDFSGEFHLLTVLHFVSSLVSDFGRILLKTELL